VENKNLEHMEKNTNTEGRRLKLSANAQLYLKRVIGWSFGLFAFSLFILLIIILELFDEMNFIRRPCCFINSVTIDVCIMSAICILLALSSCYLLRFIYLAIKSIKTQDSNKLEKSVRYLFLNLKFFFITFLAILLLYIVEMIEMHIV
jgi:hypothetical protein